MENVVEAATCGCGAPWKEDGYCLEGHLHPALAEQLRLLQEEEAESLPIGVLLQHPWFRFAILLVGLTVLIFLACWMVLAAIPPLASIIPDPLLWQKAINLTSIIVMFLAHAWLVSEVFLKRGLKRS